MFKQKNLKENAFFQIAKQLSNEKEALTGTPYICEILKKSLMLNQQGKIKNHYALDIIVQDLIYANSIKESNDEKIFSEILDSSKRKVLFDFLSNHLNVISNQDMAEAYQKKDQPSLLKGMILFLVEQYEAAETHFDNATRIEPNSIMGWFGKATALKNMGKCEDALYACDRLLEIEPANTIALMEKARILQVADKIDQSINLLRKSEKILSDKSSYHSLLGTLYIKKGDYAQARAVIENAIWIEPESCFLWLLKAFSYVFEKNFDQALEACRQALNINPNYWQAIYFIGHLNDISKDYDNALLNFDAAKKLAPEVLEISLSKIRVLRSLDKFDEALDECEHLLEKNIQYTAVWQEKSYLFVLKKEWKKVIEIFKLARKHCGDTAVLWKYLGGAYDNLNEFEYSIECYGKTLEYTPDDPYAWFNKGSVLLKASVVNQKDLLKRNKWIKEALECGKRAIELDDTFNPGWYIYGLALCQSGDMNQGLPLLEKAAKIGSFEAAILVQALKKQARTKPH